MSPARPGAKRRLSAAERREGFLDIAVEIISLRGIEALTMEGVAAEADVNKALPYRYFKNRDDLVLAVFDRDTRRFDERLAEAMVTAVTFEAQLRAIMTVYLDSLATSGLLARQFEQSRSSHHAFEQRRAEREESVLNFVAGLIRAAYTMPPRDALIAAAVLASGSQGIVGLLQNGFPQKRLVDDFVTICIAACEALATTR